MFDTSAKVIKENGKKVAPQSIPSIFQGHTFAVDISSDDQQIVSDSFRVEYVLGNSFVNDLQSQFTTNLFEEGFSNLVVSENEKGLDHISLFYVTEKHCQKVNDAKLYFKQHTESGFIQRIVIEINEESIDTAFNHSNIFVQQSLDLLAFKKGVPLEIRKVEIFDNSINKLIRTYTQIPYTFLKKVLHEELAIIPSVPERIKTLLRLFREGINSSSVYYRFLCLYRLLDEKKRCHLSDLFDCYLLIKNGAIWAIFLIVICL